MHRYQDVLAFLQNSSSVVAQFESYAVHQKIQKQVQDTSKRQATRVKSSPRQRDMSIINLRNYVPLSLLSRTMLYQDSPVWYGRFRDHPYHV